MREGIILCQFLLMGAGGAGNLMSERSERPNDDTLETVEKAHRCETPNLTPFLKNICRRAGRRGDTH